MNYLNTRGIGTRVMYPPINKQKAYNIPGEHPISNMVGKKGLWLPSSSQLSDKEIKIVCRHIRNYFQI
jgi:perosamine synthetase